MTDSDNDGIIDDGDASQTACVLTIAGSDSSGGAGIQADLKTLTALRVFGASVVTAVTAQNTMGVQGVETLSAGFVKSQLWSVLNDNDGLRVIKTGMLGNASIVRVLGRELRRVKRDLKLVLDPVLIATSGDALLDKGTGEREMVDTIILELMPLATVVTPNVPEAEALCAGYFNTEDEQTATSGIDRMKILAMVMVHDLKCRAVLIKGGHVINEGGMACDILYDGEDFNAMVKPWVHTKNTHGTGCTLASAVAAQLAKGDDLETAARKAKHFVWKALQQGARMNMGKGNGPLFHMHTVRP